MQLEGKRGALQRREVAFIMHGLPAITVVVDGGWSKRSHKHSYNGKSGVVVITGQQTGYCSACAQQIQHYYYKNWDASSSEMEIDIILECFMQAEQVHIVSEFIGDGNSSMYPTLLANIPDWGSHQMSQHSPYRRTLHCLLQWLLQMLRHQYPTLTPRV